MLTPEQIKALEEMGFKPFMDEIRNKQIGLVKTYGANQMFIMFHDPEPDYCSKYNQIPLNKIRSKNAQRDLAALKAMGIGEQR